MKYFPVIFFLIWLYVACNRNPDPEPFLPDDYWGEASAEKNGELWVAHPACWIDLVNNTNINIQIDSFYSGSYLAESLTIVAIPPFPGTYKILKSGPLPHSYLDISDGDQQLGLYLISESDSTNQMTLDSYDTLSKEIKGTFNLTFLVEHRPYSYSPDTIRFRDGKFHGKLIKK